MSQQDSSLDLNLGEESFFPTGWLAKPFRRQPYPDMTYGDAIQAAMAILWNIARPPSEWNDPKKRAMMGGAQLVAPKLGKIYEEFLEEHPEYPGRSRALVKEFNDLWRTEVRVLLEWFKTLEG